MSFICLLFTCFILPFLYQNAFISMADIFFSLQIYYNIIFEKSQSFCHFSEKLSLTNFLYKSCCIVLFEPFFYRIWTSYFVKIPFKKFKPCPCPMCPYFHRNYMTREFCFPCIRSYIVMSDYDRPVFVLMIMLFYNSFQISNPSIIIVVAVVYRVKFIIEILHIFIKDRL